MVKSLMPAEPVYRREVMKEMTNTCEGINCCESKTAG
jgi:hypothetical protein